MDAVLRIDDELWSGFGGIIGIYHLINASRTIEPRRFAIERQILRHRNCGIAQFKVAGLVFLVVCGRQKDR